MNDWARSKVIVGLLGGLLAGPANASLVYNLSLSGDITGSGKLVLADGALDSDGIFELGGKLVSFELSLPLAGVTFTSLVTGPGAGYQVVGGALIGADLFAQSSTPSWDLYFNRGEVDVVQAWGVNRQLLLFGTSPPSGSTCRPSSLGGGVAVECSGTISAEAAPPVPLPAAAWLLLSGLAGLGAMGRRKRSC